MNLNVPTLFSFLMATIFFSNSMYGQAKREDFRFEYDDIAYSGFVERPEQTPKGLIVLIPGHGSTDFVSGGEYGELIGLLSRNGFAVGVWDKAGCGQSEGTYDHNQSLESSAEEALAAIAKLREMNVPGSHQIGLWGISRAGWVC
ncbi:MAG: alpha/beta hydrolase, partial [Bacteroidota bacterium]